MPRSRAVAARPSGPRPGARDANAVLQREGHRGIMRLDEVRKVERIPVLGTGKTDYKVLRAMIGK